VVLWAWEENCTAEGVGPKWSKDFGPKFKDNKGKEVWAEKPRLTEKEVWVGKPGWTGCCGKIK
jgi:hypothetical protein